ncbi:sensor histidine kinase [Actinoplanes sp. NPDC049265]|uniref:sensor histidine kinase n=1 Tax=Actinoplanes sp. NPDC049265 TaxID=3363902 RepID=UPI0037239DAF
MNAGRFFRRLGLDTQYVLVGFPLGLIAVVLSMALFWAGVGLAVVWVGVPLLAVTFFAMRGLAIMERARVGPVLGHRLPHVAYKRATGGGFWRRAVTPLTDGQSWLDLLHAMFRFIPATIAFSVVLTWWTVAIAGLATPLYDWAITNSPDSHGLPYLLGLGDSIAMRWAFNIAIGLFFALTLYPVVRGMALLNTAFAQLLLSRFGELREQVAQAELARDTARAQKDAAVSAEAVALRRLERDIHDGPQQRLIRLAMDLGRAEQQFAQDPEAARATVTEALTQTRETLDELRALSRGIAPPILVDRGLTAALTAVAGRCTVPVELVAPGIERLDPAVESAAYFVVAESLTNVAKHSQATAARVTVRQSAGRLLIEILDDGVGGAAIDKGHGLAGLEDRVRAAGGEFDVFSAAGEGTAIRVALPV